MVYLKCSAMMIGFGKHYSIFKSGTKNVQQLSAVTENLLLGAERSGNVAKGAGGLFYGLF